MAFLVNKIPNVNDVSRDRRNGDGHALDSCTVWLSIFNPGLKIGNSDAEVNPYSYIASTLGGTNVPIKILNNEPLTLSVSTAWKDGPGASFANKINDLFNSKLMKGLGGSMFSPGTPTDGWTQQVVEKGTPLTLKLKFRSYYNARITTNVGYVNLMRFFTVLCAAQKQYTLTGAMIDPIVGAAKNMQRAVKQAKEVTDEQKKTDGETASALKNIIVAVSEATGLEDSGGKENPRGQFTLKVTTKLWKCDDLDWIVKSWTATPSQQFILNGNKPSPLWVDFDVDLETNMAPSNWFVSSFVSGVK